MKLIVEKSQLSGKIKIPASKSHTMRAILFSSFADGQSIIEDFLPSPDTQAMIAGCVQFGAKIEQENGRLIIKGNYGNLTAPDQVIDVGNSGQVLRFLSALAVLSPYYTVFTGDHSIRHRRPMAPLLQALTEGGAFAIATKNDGHAPLILRGPLAKHHLYLENGEDSQLVSALLILASFLPTETIIEVKNPGETPWVQLTLHWLERFGIKYTNRDFQHYTVQGVEKHRGFSYRVAGDWSSAAFPIAAAVVTNSVLTIENIDLEDPQGDKAIVSILEKMGAQFKIDAAQKSLTVLQHQGLQGLEIDINPLIDALPILATLACFASSPTRIFGGSIARKKESDRISTIAQELRKMGGNIEETEDGLVISPSLLQSSQVMAHADHRIAMSLAVAALACAGTTEIMGAECIAKSFAGFVSSFQGFGAKIREQI